jgi:hypothetical protein
MDKKYSSSNEQTDPSGTVGGPMVKASCAWTKKTIACDKKSDKKCTGDSVNFGKDSCCMYGKIVENPDILVRGQLYDGGYPYRLGVEGFYCMNKADNDSEGYWGW